MAKVNLSPPWDIYYHEISAFFEKDPEVKILYDEAEKKIRLYVNNSKKANALTKIIPCEKEFGNVTLYIEVIPSNDVLFSSTVTNLQDAFINNRAVSRIEEINMANFNAIYILFNREIVQYFIDNLGDFNGVKSTLYEDIARNIFENIEGNVFFCTEVPLYSTVDSSSRTISCKKLEWI